VSFGAIQVTQRQIAGMNLRRRITGQLGDPATAEEWMREYIGQRHAARKDGA
jgi:hypothetical protein